MDMWEPYIAATRARICRTPRTKIVFDKFHIAQHAQRRRRQGAAEENKTLKAREMIA